MDHPWPGNVRELEHALEHAFVICRGETIEPEHLPVELRGALRGERQGDKAPVNEQQLILAALTACNWRREQAATQLGMSRATLFRKMRQMGIVARKTIS
ncbi:MAG: hypothetical protein HQL95_08780 [Magnetococcales bacterium]|nr:hypothetical protein [Magnetococcales bacterium]